MAISSSNIRVGLIFSAIIKGFEAFRKAGRGLKGLAAAVKKVRAELVGLVLTELFSFMADAVSVFADFDHSMKKVMAVTNATGKELAELTEEARRLGREFPFTASEAADAMFELSLAGLKVNEVMIITETVLNLAMAGSMSLAKSARIAVATMNAFGMAAEDVEMIGDKLTTAFTNSATTLHELGAGLSFVAPVAKMANMTLADTVTILGLMANAGIVGARTGTTLRQMISKMLDPTTDAALRMKELGLAFTDANDDMLPMVDILQSLIDAQMTANDVITVFGIRAAPGIGALINQGVAKFEELNAAIINSEGELQRIADTMEMSAQITFKKFTSAVEDLKIEIGIALMPVLEELINLFRHEDGLGVAITEIVIALTGLLLILARLIADLQPVINAFGYFTKLLMEHPEIINVVFGAWGLLKLQALGLALHTAYLSFSITILAKSIRTMWASLWPVLVAMGIALTIWLLWEQIIWAVEASVTALVSAIERLWKALTTDATLGEVFGGFWDDLANDVPRPVGTVQAKVEQLGFAKGGMVKEEGWYKLHAGELVRPAGGVDASQTTGDGRFDGPDMPSTNDTSITNNVSVHGIMGADDVASAVVRAISKQQRIQAMR